MYEIDAFQLCYAGSRYMTTNICLLYLTLF